MTAQQPNNFFRITLSRQPMKMVPKFWMVKGVALVGLLCGATLWTVVADKMPPSGRISDFRDPNVGAEDDWTVLFNGRDLKGWVPVIKTPEGTAKKFLEHEVSDQTTFSVQDGSLFTTGSPSGYLRTEDVYENYVFQVEVRLMAPGNSGVLVHIQKDEIWPRSIECQLYFAHMGRIFPLNGATLDGGEMFHAAARPVGEWNSYQIYAEEGRLATVLNGKLIGLASKADPRLGYICLQSEGVPAEFRNVKIRRHTPKHSLRPKPAP